MKKIFLAMILLTSFAAYSQTGLNMSSPSAALDIVSKGNSNTTKALEINDNADKELLSVSDNGTVLLENYKNYSFLGTDANGYLKDGTALDIPSITTIASRNATTGSSSSAYNVQFAINKIILILLPLPIISNLQ
ncbi:hypothetical protein [Chryseobacterium kwangjuense]|uniref:Uncharacterized protein n=1 Tax=Chryseobacterium kwangjuense TaxID=267125 RepID=A0A135WHW1_9FLAO|nr:hypothetical protein [Chryseobacterium kwangjuense]KXH84508.1 hypothetical protein AU378_01720 [Chryseobacterium kwangjuense]